MSLSPIYLSAFHLSPNVTGIVYATSNLKHSLQLEIWPLFLIHPFFYFHPPAPKFHIMYDHFNWLSTWVILFQSRLMSPMLMNFISVGIVRGRQFSNKIQHRLLKDIVSFSVLYWKPSRSYPKWIGSIQL